TALGRLAQRHATRELEVDRLLRGGVLVDLYRAVRQGLRASVESYSIKRLEPLYNLQREVELRDAGASIVAFEAWLEGGVAEGGQAGEDILRSIAGYNRDDVVSNLRLRDWLEDRRADLERQVGSPLARPLPPDPGAPAALSERDQRVADLVERLTDGVPADPAGRADVEQGRWLLAQLLGFHRREDKASWWRFYALAAMTDDELVDEREPLGRIELTADLGPVSRAGSRLQRFRFPLQDHGLKVGRAVINPRTVHDTGTKACGTVHEIDEVGLTVTLKRSPAQLRMPLPEALIPYDFVGSEEIQASLVRLAEWILEHGLDGTGEHAAARDLLLRRPRRPEGNDPALRRSDESPLEAAVRLGLVLDDAALAIQGPPGSGKTYTGAQMIVALVRAGRRVGVTATSHKVIGNALDKVADAAARDGLAVRLGQKAGQEEDPTCSRARPLGTTEARDALAAREVDVVGGTAWLWSREELAGSVDVLFVDEAGQLSLANAVAVAPAARSIVLLGDPQQLEQPRQGTHPPGAERSALGHVLGDAAVMPPERGLFLTQTWRLHPDICDFTSEVFYEGQLTWEPTLARQDLHGSWPADGTGVRWMTVEHAGNATESPEEAAAVTAIVRSLLEGGGRWTDRKGAERPLTLGDIVIVAPYNAHVERIATTLAGAGYAAARVGTVDKFQGQEAPISIYAMGSSSAEEAPRGLEFLYSLNRLNVATSRARCAALVVASPALVRVQCHSPRQMRLANALCRLVEVADDQASAAG
ncbi:MAG TPA: AAA domain-containing protein, partial [Candidatus Deferrimicrobiaceae bacterium]|nr:AAA domain-containing protein [Candidatus Deferrimicrobiaceae bacterium]